MKLFYSTEEVCTHLNVPKSTLEYYILTFRLKIKKMGRDRKFTHNDIEKLEKIIHLIQNEGFTIEGAKEQLKIKQKSDQELSEIIERLQEVRKSLIILRDGIE